MSTAVFGDGFSQAPNTWSALRELTRASAGSNVSSPGRSTIPAPIFIVQGEDDGLVHPDVTEAFARSLCAEGQAVDYRSYPDVHHITAVDVVTPDVAAWIVARFVGEPAPSTCS